MHKHDQEVEKRGSAESEPSLARRVLMTPLYMLGMGLLLTFVVAGFSNLLENFLDPITGSRLPGYGFAVGLALGFAAGISKAMKAAVGMFAGLIVAGGLLAFFAMVIVGGGLIVIEVSEDTVDRIMNWVIPLAFLLPFALAVLVGTDELLELFRSRVRRRPSS
jgi:hypothetical protein